MSHRIESIVGALKAARKAKGWSQRTLGEKAGVPQSHVSNIESGVVDLRVSSLLELARILDLELALVPRKALPAVQSVVRATKSEVVPQAKEVVAELRRWKSTLAHFSNMTKANTEFAQMQRQLRELQHLALPKSELERLKEIRKSIESLDDHVEGKEALRKALAQIQGIRNSLAHASAHPAAMARIRPAYSLDEEDGDA